MMVKSSLRLKNRKLRSDHSYLSKKMESLHDSKSHKKTFKSFSYAVATIFVHLENNDKFAHVKQYCIIICIFNNEWS